MPDCCLGSGIVSVSLEHLVPRAGEGIQSDGGSRSQGEGAPTTPIWDKFNVK